MARGRHKNRLAAALLGFALTVCVHADEPEPQQTDYVEDVTVSGRADELVGIADSATEGNIAQDNLAMRPILRPAEVLEAVPGVIVTQHSGSGKANQYFVRGFNLDHGTDFRISVDGIPVNNPSHGHGQGYADLNFLIPELVRFEQYRKGPYAARDGDFSAAGAADIELVRTLPAPIFEGTGGNEGFARILAAASREAGGGDVLGAFEYHHSDGPWVHPDDYKKYSGVLRFSRSDAASGFDVTAMGYSGAWSSTDQIPRRAVAGGAVDRFGAIDTSDGGESSRYSLSGGAWGSSGATAWKAQLYALHYDLSLFSNFTYFLDDPVNGDQFEQEDRRFVAGFATSASWRPEAGGRTFETEAGAQLRRDAIDNGLFHAVARQRIGTTRQDDITQLGGGPYVETRVKWEPWLRTVFGIRGDFYHANVKSDLPANSGTADDFLLSPKASFVFGPWKATEYYVNAGYGFHSNDARGATITIDPATGDPAGRVQPLVRAKSYDVGVRTQAIQHLQATLSAFRLDLDSELVFVGDAGGTEAGRPSRRTGIELATFYQAQGPWSFDFDLALSKSRFTDDDPAGDRIPGSIETAINTGFTVTDFHRFFGSLRARYFGPRPLIEDDGVRSASSTLVSTDIGYKFGHGIRVTLSVFNLLDDHVSDIDYYYRSQLPGEPAPVDDVHFHPAEGRSFRLALAFNPR